MDLNLNDTSIVLTKKANQGLIHSLELSFEGDSLPSSIALSIPNNAFKTFLNKANDYQLQWRLVFRFLSARH